MHPTVSKHTLTSRYTCVDLCTRYYLYGKTTSVILPMNLTKNNVHLTSTSLQCNHGVEHEKCNHSMGITSLPLSREPTEVPEALWAHGVGLLYMSKYFICNRSLLTTCRKTYRCERGTNLGRVEPPRRVPCSTAHGILGRCGYRRHHTTYRNSP